MRILVLNPNTSTSVTDLLMASAGRAAAPDVGLLALTAPRGFPYISTAAEAQIAGALVLEMLAAQKDVDAAIVAAFGDPGLLAARELFDFPVIGMSEAAMLTACMLGRRFGIVTFAPDLGAWYRDCVEMHGLSARCAGIRSLSGSFSSVGSVQAEQADALVELSNRSVKEDGADVIVLAGAPLAGLAAKAAGRISVPVVDPIGAAVRQAETLVALAPGKARAGSSRAPAPKSTIGLPAALAGHWERQMMKPAAE